ncbi:hypothetical protein GJ496_002346 [Pomphorhynchus laevis]|nr:hypothetical protein GJ496_002346 [Pomphorhynchus laevis]
MFSSIISSQSWAILAFDNVIDNDMCVTTMNNQIVIFDVDFLLADSSPSYDVFISVDVIARLWMNRLMLTVLSSLHYLEMITVLNT